MPSEAVLREVEAWIAKAESDFRNIELVLPAEDAPLDTVCFHAQQAAEKYIKAALTFAGIPFGKTHDLSELAALLADRFPLLSSVGDLSDLTDAAVTARYPDDLVVYDRDLAEELVERARAVRVAALHDLASQGYIRGQR
ncbi:MAG: HEPN domain-containing protein [Armatimonadota bacterium]|nr:HEPN domain-containing protein [Armatimonadota bacterium]